MFTCECSGLSFKIEIFHLTYIFALDPPSTSEVSSRQSGKTPVFTIVRL